MLKYFIIVHAFFTIMSIVNHSEWWKIYAVVTSVFIGLFYLEKRIEYLVSNKAVRTTEGFEQKTN